MSAEGARALLNSLIDRIEEKPVRVNAVGVKPPRQFDSAADRRAFEMVLGNAKHAGAVELYYPHTGETRHLLERVVLKDQGKLYAFLDRQPACERADAVASTLREALPCLHPDALSCLNRLQEGWRLAKKPFLVGPETGEAMRFLRALDAVLRRPEDDRRDLRTFSAQALGDSKLLEGQLGRIIPRLAEIGRIPPGLSMEDGAAALGLEKFGHPVLVAGDVLLDGQEISGLAYLGIAPDDIEKIAPATALTAVLTIENLASFNRHVREARSPREAVVYTGGFPTPSVIALLRRLVAPGRTAFWHWGDVDVGGVRIADHLARQVDRGLRLHLMSGELTTRCGRKASAIKDVASLDGSEDVRVLAGLLSSEESHHLEQEVVDPARLGCHSAT